MKPPIHSPEFKLLLSCCRVRPSSKELESRATAIAQGIDDLIFLQLVKRHMVAPLVFYNLKDETGISKQLIADLKNIAEQNQFKTLITKQMIIRLQKKFIELNIKGLFLKGVPVSELYYGDVGLRDTMDIDVWVEEPGFIKISGYLHSLGYKSNLDLSKLNKSQVAYKYKTDHHLLFSIDHPGYPSIIELHWKIRGRLGIFTFDPKLRYQELTYYKTLNIDIPIFSHVDNFLFLCTHGCDHAWYRLKWLFDFPQILDKVEFDWDEVIKRAKTLHCVEQVKLTFMLLNKLIGESIPVQIEQQIRNTNLSWSLNYIEHIILYNGSFCDTDKEKLLNLRYVLSQNKKGFFNPTLILRHLTSKNDWKLLPLPNYLFFLYFPLRPFLLLWRRFAGNKT